MTSRTSRTLRTCMTFRTFRTCRTLGPLITSQGPSGRLFWISDRTCKHLPGDILPPYMTVATLFMYFRKPKLVASKAVKDPTFLAASGARPALMIALLLFLFLLLFLLAFSSFSHLSLKVFLYRAMAHFVPSRGT
jgi:hypothetical protein